LRYTIEDVGKEHKMPQEKIKPDPEDYEQTERDYPNATPAEKHQLAQASALLRLTKAESLDELHHMAEAGLLETLIHEHNKSGKGSG
jgi:hypothetical protein